MDRAAAAAGLWARIVELVHDLSPDDWRRSTPCPGWDVHDLIGHLSGVQVAFDARRVVRPPAGWTPDPDLGPLDRRVEAAVAARRSWGSEQVLEELASARAGHAARLRAVDDWSAPAEGPAGPTTEEGLFRVRMFDLWVHLQDLRIALGLPVEADDASPAAEAAHGYVLDLLPWLFVKRAAAPEGARMRVSLGPPLDVDTVVVVRGGRARFDEAAALGAGPAVGAGRGVGAARGAEPRATAEPDRSALVGIPAGLTLLAAGRWTPLEAAEHGALHAEGPLGEAFAARARLF